ncbi:MAG: hypothetical protein QM635_04000 [Microbacteriaceae bacterium]
MAAIDELVSALAAVRGAVARLSRLSPAELTALSDGELDTVRRSIDEDRRRLGALAARLDDELAARSACTEQPLRLAG